MTLASGSSVSPGSENRIPLQQAKNEKEQGKVAYPVTNLGLSTTHIMSGTTMERFLHSKSSECLSLLT